MSYNPDDDLSDFLCMDYSRRIDNRSAFQTSTIDLSLGLIVKDIPVSGDALLIENSLQVVGSMTYDMGP